MEFEMASIYNSSEEIAGSSGYTNIRMYDLAHMTSEVEEDELLAEADGWDRWADAADGDRLALFSAVCFLTARTTSDFIGGKVTVESLMGAPQKVGRFSEWAVRGSITTKELKIRSRVALKSGSPIMRKSWEPLGEIFCVLLDKIMLKMYYAYVDKLYFLVIQRLMA